MLGIKEEKFVRSDYLNHEIWKAQFDESNAGEDDHADEGDPLQTSSDEDDNSTNTESNTSDLSVFECSEQIDIGDDT